MSDHRPQPRSSTTHDFNHPYVRPSQYDMLERNTCPPPPPPRIKQPERRTRIYHEQHISHHIPAVRQHYAYKPALSGKAAEVLGVDDVREFEHNFSEKLEKKKKKAKTWRTRKFRVTKNDAKKTKVKRTVPVERVQTLPRSDSAVEIPSMSHFSWSGDEDKIKKFRLHKKEMGVKEGKRSARCTIM